MSLPTLSHSQTAYTLTGYTAPTDAQVIQALNTASATLTKWRVISVDTGSWNYIELAPPVSSPLASMRVLITVNPGNNTYCQTPDTAANAIWIGLAPDGGTLGTWNSTNPYSSARWTKYWRCCANAVAESLYFIESAEDLMIVFRDDSADTFYGVLVGAIIEAGVGSFETSSQRVFGIVTGGSTSISGTFHASNSTFLNHSGSAGGAHTGFFKPTAPTTFDISFSTFNNPTISSGGSVFTYLNNKEIALPIYTVYGGGSPRYLLGYLRQKYYTQDRTQRTVITGVGIVFAGNGSSTASQDSLLFSNI